ncbi:proteobacterial dedicated sortase system histidine kinase [Beggiatoa leptomitoformis]|uniref:histidine kinase n=1 Tax=Beggiatoa leptomitoformis TaxID=288004 RepID=A0A2N9YIC5_9GAMM|nr:proteobacterial dedicated sortase system histidine kinase [Beggiatoa leptomitoformis]ALG67518.1 proteobacterial dedicated sortase system histidine kinase [Beggiatoa leptomitoformis]AUI70257.1 proteobacterial dedicated sortase system histidine kinase [Beggiatoa leptomitoformis]
MILSIRSKVLLLSLTLLSVPYVGYEYVREMEIYLRENLETSLKDSAKAIASILNNKSDLFNRSLLDTVQADPFTKLPDYPLRNAIQLDGNIEDWRDIIDNVKDYGEEHLLYNNGTYTPNSSRFQFVMSKSKTHLFALFIVQDDKVIYRPSSGLNVEQGDHIEIILQEPDGRLYRHLIPPTNEGWVTGYKISSRNTYYIPDTDSRIQAHWSITKKGYVVEVRIPLQIIGSDRMGFAVADVDDTEERTLRSLIGTSAIRNQDENKSIFVYEPEAENILTALGETAGRRVWVLDQQRRVLAKRGDLQRELGENPLNAFFSLLLPPNLEEFNDAHGDPERIEEGMEVNKALQGEPEKRWRGTKDEQVVIVSFAHPIWVNKQVAGVVVVEETSNRIQTLQRQAIANLFTKTLLMFFFVSLLLVFFATRLSFRLRRLRNQAEAAIDNNGRVTTTKIGSTAKDEIGDLSRSFSAILEKLQQYNTYLEGMSSRLSHELRTPIAVVRSSLENLEQEVLDAEASIYIERAKQGIDRLSTLITRLSEATRLEQALQNVDREIFDLSELVNSCISGYRLAYPQQRFWAELTNLPIFIDGAPDLIAQMLDKLVSNAVDFSEPDAPIRIELQQERGMARLRVTNQGIPLPTDMQERIFESMVSLRNHGHKKEPHLGLGLYMVRLIVWYHGGNVKADNNADEKGVIFTVHLPTKVTELLVN